MLFTEGIYYPGYSPGGEQGAIFNYDKNVSMITILLSHIQGYEIKAVKKAPITFYLNKLANVIFLSLDVGRALMFDCPYSVHRVNPDERQIPNDPGPGMGLPVTVVLVDSETAIIRAVRVTTFSRQLTLLFAKLVMQQMEEPYDCDFYEADLREIENRYSPEEMRHIALITYKSK